MDGETSTSDPESPQKKTARLRAFVVDSNIHGKGVGRKLVSAAIEWADKQGFEETELWTFKGLNAARKLYDGFDFVLMEEVLSWKWGKELMVQHFVRKAGGKR
jgi:GNAT superfamily N-acetyltransferase